MRKLIKLEVTEMELNMIIIALEESFNHSNIGFYNDLAIKLDVIRKDKEDV